MSDPDRDLFDSGLDFIALPLTALVPFYLGAYLGGSVNILTVEPSHSSLLL